MPKAHISELEPKPKRASRIARSTLSGAAAVALIAACASPSGGDAKPAPKTTTPIEAPRNPSNEVIQPARSQQEIQLVDDIDEKTNQLGLRMLDVYQNSKVKDVEHKEDGMFIEFYVTKDEGQIIDGKPVVKEIHASLVKNRWFTDESNRLLTSEIGYKLRLKDNQNYGVTPRDDIGVYDVSEFTLGSGNYNGSSIREWYVWDNSNPNNLDNDSAGNYTTGHVRNGYLKLTPEQVDISLSQIENGLASFEQPQKLPNNL